ncbi:MAG TPA: hypothetical protein VJB87_03915 [Candidatus Nanoarchaeia archaeon]|nr:hypothetical protein [Candidatus Nanoarchaeia archaeon]
MARCERCNSASIFLKNEGKKPAPLRKVYKCSNCGNEWKIK